MARDLQALLCAMTGAQKASLTAGTDLWTVPGVRELAIPHITCTDGPNGARGSGLLGTGRETSLCVPCGASLGATWDTALVEEVGAVLGEEARTKGARMLLAPTINLPRSPLYGRSFECYSEDPLLTGHIALAFIAGVQSRGVAATPKHYVANETEFERTTISSELDERTLRELYLVPFELALSRAWAVMTGYNRVHGRWVAEDRRLLADVLRGDLGFDGVVMTDWYAVGSTTDSALAGLDLQMPGPPRFYGPALAAAVVAGDVQEATLDAIAGRWLALIERLDAWDDGPAGEQSVELPAHREVARRAAAAGTVLLRNDGVLPLRDSGTIALLGPGAARTTLMGGGSAQLRPHRRTSVLEAFRARFGDRVVHEPGCSIDVAVPALTGPTAVEYFATDDWSGPVVATSTELDLRLLWAQAPEPGLDVERFSLRARMTLPVDEPGEHLLTLVQAGRARVLVNGVVVLDGITEPPPPGTEFFSFGSQELSVVLALDAPALVVVEWSSLGSTLLHGLQVGHRRLVPDDGITRAVAAAAAADVAVVVVGTTPEWETEGHDRDSMSLPGEQDELLRRVCAANPRTVVVVNVGAPVELSSADAAAAIVLPWLGGQEMGEAVVQVLLGEAEPAGRLPVSFPLRIEHTPAFGSFPGENGRTTYSEGLLSGYRWYDTRHLPVAFAFGHGGSYSSYAWSAPVVVQADDAVTVQVQVTCTGDRPGTEVLQCYIQPRAARLVRPRRELKAFATLHLAPGESAIATLVLPPRAFAYWDPGSAEHAAVRERLGDAAVVPATQGPLPVTTPGWYVDPGTYDVLLARSVVDVVDSVPVEVSWSGRIEG